MWEHAPANPKIERGALLPKLKLVLGFPETFNIYLLQLLHSHPEFIQLSWKRLCAGLVSV